MYLKEQKQTILIVEDLSVNIRLIGECIKDKWVLKFAKNVKKAKEILSNSEKPDLVILDIILRDESGYDLCSYIRCNKETKDIPIIFITGLDEEEDEVRALDLGGIDYIKKPFNKDILLGRIKNHLELKSYRDKLKNISMIDGLTGISNKDYFNDVLPRKYEEAILNKRKFAIFMIDIDYFKDYNDTFGHILGDKTLKKVAQRLDCTVNKYNGLLSRWGGEEFSAIILENKDTPFIDIAKILKDSVEDLKIEVSKALINDYLTISIGAYAIYPDISIYPFDLVERADINLYEAKNRGRNAVVFSER